MKHLAALSLLLLAGADATVRAEDGLGHILDRVYIVPGGPDRAASKPVSAITENELLSRIEKELTSRMNLDGELRLSFARTWQNIKIASDDWQVKVVDLPLGGLSRNFMLRVKISTPDRVWFDQQVVLEAQLWKQVLVSTRRLEKGQSIDSTAAEVQPMDILRDHISPIPANTKLEDQEVLQAIAEGHALTNKDLAPAPLVRKGSIVEVVAGEGGMSISMKGIAQGDGGPGDPITIRNMDTRKDFQARVVSRNSVRVTF